MCHPIIGLPTILLGLNWAWDSTSIVWVSKRKRIVHTVELHDTKRGCNRAIANLGMTGKPGSNAFTNRSIPGSWGSDTAGRLLKTLGSSCSRWITTLVSRYFSLCPALSLSLSLSFSLSLSLSLSLFSVCPLSILCIRWCFNTDYTFSTFLSIRTPRVVQIALTINPRGRTTESSSSESLTK